MVSIWLSPFYGWRNWDTEKSSHSIQDHIFLSISYICPFSSITIVPIFGQTSIASLDCYKASWPGQPVSILTTQNDFGRFNNLFKTPICARYCLAVGGHTKLIRFVGSSPSWLSWGLFDPCVWYRSPSPNSLTCQSLSTRCSSRMLSSFLSPLFTGLLHHSDLESKVTTSGKPSLTSQLNWVPLLQAFEPLGTISVWLAIVFLKLIQYLVHSRQLFVEKGKGDRKKTLRCQK